MLREETPLPCRSKRFMEKCKPHSLNIFRDPLLTGLLPSALPLLVALHANETTLHKPVDYRKDISKTRSK